MPNQLTTQDGTVLDPKVLKVMKAIRSVESQGNYNAIGDSGASYGAFQYNEQTGPGWKSIAKQYLGDENAVMDKANQNKATYLRIKDWKDNGYKGKQVDPEEIAALWNGATLNPQTNRYEYNAPEYGQKFRQALMGSQAPTQYQTQPTMGGVQTAHAQTGDVSQTEEKDTLGSSLSKRVFQAGSAISDTASGKQGLISGVLQLGGAGAGAVLDTTGAALKATPVIGSIIKGTEKLVGKGVEKGLETDAGQDLLTGYSKFAEENPIAAKNIGSIANMVSVIPLFRGVAMGVGAAKGAINSAFRESIEQAAEKELTQTISRVRSGGMHLRDVSDRGMNPIGQIVKDPDLLPEIDTDAKGIARYNTSKAEQRLSDQIDDIDDKLDVELAKATGSDLGGYVPLETMRQIAQDSIKRELKGSPDLVGAIKKVDSDFDSIGMSYGDMVTLNDLNAIKRMVRKSVNFDSPSLDRNVRYYIGQSIMKTIEDVASKRGLDSVRAINREMAEKIEAQNILQKYINAKSVPENPGWKSLTSRAMETPITAAGEAVGQSFGTPLVGGMLAKATHGVLMRGKKGAVDKLRSIPARKGARGLVNSKKKLKEAVKVHELPPRSQDAFRKFKRDKSLDSKDADVQEKSIYKYLKDKSSLLNESLKRDGKVANTDEKRKLFKDVGYEGRNSAAVQEAASELNKDHWRYLLKNNPEPEGVLYAGGSGTGKTSVVQNLLPEAISKSAAILDGNLSSLSSATRRIKEVIDAGKTPRIVYVYREPVDAWVNGVIARMKNNKNEGGRVVPLSVFLENHKGSWETVNALKDKYVVDMIDNSFGGKNYAKMMSLDKFKNIKYTDIRSKLLEATKQQLEYGKITPEEYKALIK